MRVVPLTIARLATDAATLPGAFFSTYWPRRNIRTYHDVPGTDDRYDGAMNFI